MCDSSLKSMSVTSSFSHWRDWLLIWLIWEKPFLPMMSSLSVCTVLKTGHKLCQSKWEREREGGRRRSRRRIRPWEERAGRVYHAIFFKGVLYWLKHTHSLTIQTQTEEQACTVTSSTTTLRCSPLMLQEALGISIRLEALNLPWSPAGHCLLPESRSREVAVEERALQHAFWLWFSWPCLLLWDLEPIRSWGCRQRCDIWKRWDLCMYMSVCFPVCFFDRPCVCLCSQSM